MITLWAIKKRKGRKEKKEKEKKRNKSGKIKSQFKKYIKIRINK